MSASTCKKFILTYLAITFVPFTRAPFAPTCSQYSPAPSNGYISSSSLYFGTGSTVSFGCNAGYNLSSGFIMCLFGTFVGNAPTCDLIPIPCKSQYSPAPTNGHVTSSPPYANGTDVTFECNNGFQMIGTSKGITCIMGKFVTSPGAPTCTPAPCTVQPAAPINGYLVSLPPYSHLQIVIFACDENFSMAPFSGVQCQFGVFVGSLPVCSSKFLPQPVTSPDAVLTTQLSTATTSASSLVFDNDNNNNNNNSVYFNFSTIITMILGVLLAITLVIVVVVSVLLSRRNKQLQKLKQPDAIIQPSSPTVQKDSDFNNDIVCTEDISPYEEIKSASANNNIYMNYTPLKLNNNFKP